VYRDIKTGEVKAGVEDRIQQVSHSITVNIGDVCHAYDSHCGGAVASRDTRMEDCRICATDGEGLYVEILL
jgi:hypothetical protein